MYYGATPAEESDPVGHHKEQIMSKPVITFTAEAIPGTNAYAGIVWKDGAIAKRCEHRHSGFTSAKGCADLRKAVEAVR